MIVPKYWAEANTIKTTKGKQYTLKRFGWSDVSEEDAKSHAETRLQEAVTTLETKGDVRRIDHKVAYNGAEGIPIREEVISTHEDMVISRNSYGALCLNTPDVMFVDIDFEDNVKLSLSLSVFSSLACLSIILGIYAHSWLIFVVALLISAFNASTIANKINQLILNTKGGAEKKALEEIKTVAEKNPELNLRVYRTPKGLRILVMNTTYEPQSDDALGLMDALNSDIMYIHMCKNQNCFRARLSPKPWRIGLERIKPNPGVWPVKKERLEERNDWVKHYEKISANYSACHFLAHIGSNITTPKAEHIRELHDRLAKVDRLDLRLG